MARLLIISLIAGALAASQSCCAEELRGAWISAWALGYFTADQTDATVTAAKKAGINALYVQVRKNADSYYESKLEPRAKEVEPDFDPLACLIEKAHAQGIQVHAWVNAFRVWTTRTDPDISTHVVRLHPDWINRTADGKTRAAEGIYLDPGVPGVRDHIAKVVLDIATRYDVDGIQWDYIRYPGHGFGYSDAALARYRADTGTKDKPDPHDRKWLQWKRDQVTALVRTVSQQVHKIKPKIVISASTTTWGNCPTDFAATEAYSTVCQDWRAWLAEGILDANLPMTYRAESSAIGSRSFRTWLDGFKMWNGGKPTYVGINVSKNSDVEVLAQIKAVREARLQGFVLYEFNQSQRRDKLVEALAAGLKPAP